MANLSNINNKFIVTDGGNGRVLIGATNDIGATLFANHPSTTAPSLTFNAPAGQVFENEDLQIAFGLNNASPYNGYMQTRFVSAPYYRNLAINPLGGDVGIGTNSPAAKLDVQGGARFESNVGIGTAPTSRQLSVFRTTAGSIANFLHYTDASNFQGLYIQVSQTTDMVTLQSSGASGGGFIFSSGNAEKIRFTATGNVGIGTDSPDLGGVAGTRVLTIASPTAERWGILELAGNRTWGGNQVGELKFISTDSTNNGTLVSLIAINDPTATGTGGSLKFSTRANGGSLTERMRIANTLITVPTVTEIRADIGSNKFAIGNMGDASSQMMVSSRGFLTFNVSNTGSGLDATERMRINATGNVLIGNPSVNHAYKLQIEGNDIMLNTENSIQGKSIYARYSSQFTIQCDSELRFSTGGSPTQKMVIQAGGNVGLGNTIPYSRLDLNGVLSIGPASLDPSFTVTSTDVSTIAGGSLELVQGFGGTTSAGDTIVFTYEAQSWKAFQYEYCISAAYGLSKGGGGGYNNNGMTSYYYVTTNQGSNVNVTSVASNSGGSSNQYVIVTITGIFGIHPCVSFKYTQSGGDGAPRADRATLAFNS